MLLSGLTALALMGLAWTWPLWGEALRLACPFRALTGIACPTCGGTRALLAAARGDLGTALQFNPLVGLATTGLLAWIPLSLAWVAGRWPRPDLEGVVPRWGRPGARLLALLVGFNWLWLVVHGTV